MPRTPVVPNSSDVLKQDCLQSFKTRRFNFAMDGKIMPCGGSTQQRCFKSTNFFQVLLKLVV
ncbi:hypothetical protein FUT81_01450 [Treponema phagedenis]|nr:hypothetical protein FUT81_01450 [Treponema phagedenis]